MVSYQQPSQSWRSPPCESSTLWWLRVRVTWCKEHASETTHECTSWLLSWTVGGPCASRRRIKTEAAKVSLWWASFDYLTATTTVEGGKRNSAGRPWLYLFEKTALYLLVFPFLVYSLSPTPSVLYAYATHCLLAMILYSLFHLCSSSTAGESVANTPCVNNYRVSFCSITSFTSSKSGNVEKSNNKTNQSKTEKTTECILH